MTMRIMEKFREEERSIVENAIGTLPENEKVNIHNCSNEILDFYNNLTQRFDLKIVLIAITETNLNLDQIKR